MANQKPKKVAKKPSTKPEAKKLSLRQQSRQPAPSLLSRASSLASATRTKIY